MENIKKIPVHIITGFLGAGKTTFLNQLIKSQLPERIVVIENEIGDTNIDGALVLNEVNSVVELTAGCICCSLNDELLDVLEMLATQNDTFDRLIIETTGVAEPEAIVEIFLSHRGVETYFELQNVICLVDAKFLNQSLEDTDTPRRQILAADILLLNKIDLIENALQTTQLLTILRGINPLAQIYEGSQGVFPHEEIITFSTIKNIGAETQTRNVKQNHNHTYHDITTFCLTFEEEFKLPDLSYELTRLLSLYRHQIYRIKGIIAYDNEPTKAIIQSVRNMIALTDGTTWAEGEIRQSKIVFIGKGVKREAIERIFNRCLVKPIPVAVTAQNSVLSRSSIAKFKKS